MCWFEPHRVHVVVSLGLLGRSVAFSPVDLCRTVLHGRNVEHVTVAHQYSGAYGTAYLAATTRCVQHAGLALQHNLGPKVA
jgi:hypothetical protein